MRAAWLVPLLIVACSVELEPLVAEGEDAGSGTGGGGGKDASADNCSWNCGNGGSGASGGADAAGGSGAQAGFGTGGDGAVAGGSNGGSSGSGASGVGGAGGVGGGSGGSGPAFQCYPINQIPIGCDQPNQQACSCLGCNYPVCEDQFGPLDDCVCFECWDSPSCPPQACNGDGLCDPYGESCGCPDCKFHPECYGY